MKYKILVVEDDVRLASMLASEFERYGYESRVASRLHDVKGEFLEFKPQIVILDINLPYMDGFYWCRQIRTVSSVPIIFLSARTSDMDQVRAIENGGDDYITKPFSMEVAVAKVGSVIRRVYGEYSGASEEHGAVYSVAGLCLSRLRGAAEFRDRRVELTKNEFRLLDKLARKPGVIVSREELLEALWDDADFVDDNTLTVNVARVRRKLEDLGIERSLETVRGQGYRLVVNWEGSLK